MMQGTPYIYQGEEFGMTNPYFDTIEEYRDVESINYYNILKEQGESEADIVEILRSKSRDNSRTPIQWNSEENAGFTTGTPWIPVAKSYKEINAEDALKDDNSIFYHYKKLIDLRKNSEYSDTIIYGEYKLLLPDDEQIFAYIREDENYKLLLVANFSEEEVTRAIEGEVNQVILSNYDATDYNLSSLKLRPYETVIFELKKY